MIGHFKEKNGNKYFVSDDVDENKEVSMKYQDASEGVQKEIETINGDEKIKDEKDLKVRI